MSRKVLYASIWPAPYIPANIIIILILIPEKRHQYFLYTKLASLFPAYSRKNRSIALKLFRFFKYRFTYFFFFNFLFFPWKIRFRLEYLFFLREFFFFFQNHLKFLKSAFLYLKILNYSHLLGNILFKKKHHYSRIYAWIYGAGQACTDNRLFWIFKLEPGNIGRSVLSPRLWRF